MALHPSRVTAIVGAGFGDEGKGFWTDAHAARAVQDGLDTWVVRFNGGAQAGHTVTTLDGRRHVFHHVGSGALVGASTYLSRHVALHPMLLPRELDELQRLGAPPPHLMVDPRAPVTVPYDVMINQALEASRGDRRHGSCGVGFGETLEREEHPGFSLRAANLGDADCIRACLAACRDVYVPQRLAALGLPRDSLAPWLHRADIVDRFVADALSMASRVTCAMPGMLLRAGAVVFEGAQGLRLDQDLGEFPHVTRSRTGLPQALDVATEAGLAHLDVVYVTRAYVTRHGAGPLPNEQAASPAPRFADLTNQPNPHQGHLRFAPLDPNHLVSFIQQDLARAQGSSVTVTPGLAVNCLDQMGATTPLAHGPSIATRALAPWLAAQMGWASPLEAWGPSRQAAHWR